MWMEHETVVLEGVFQLQAADHDLSLRERPQTKNLECRWLKGLEGLTYEKREKSSSGIAVSVSEFAWRSKLVGAPSNGGAYLQRCVVLSIVPLGSRSGFGRTARDMAAR